MDEHYDKVSLLLPMSGADQGTDFHDYSPVPKTVTRFGDTKTVTAQSKYYGSSGYFDGSGDQLSIPHADDLDIGSGDFTVELWVRQEAIGGFSVILDWRDAPAVTSRFCFLGLNAEGAMVFDFGGGSSWHVNMVSQSPLPVATWTHIAVTREGSGFRVWINGTGDVTATNAGVHTKPTTPLLVSGTSTGTVMYNGYIQDLRITKDVSRYTANFTPPARLIAPVSGTVTDAAGAVAARKVFAVPRLCPQQIFGPVDSSAVDGSYELWVPTTEVSRIVLDSATEAPIHNDLIDRVIPQ